MPQHNLILFGFKGVGKSFLGQKLAERLGMPFIDTDRMIEQLYLKRYEGPHSCRQICILEGELFFRQLESEVIVGLQTAERAIIALGGGAILDPQNRIILEQIGTLIYLELDKELLKKRMLEGGVPSFLDKRDIEGSFEKVYHERKPIYESIAARRLQIGSKSVTALLSELIMVEL